MTVTHSNLWQVRGRTLDTGPRTLIMGILNVTPDSFSDGGRHTTPEQAADHAGQMARDGADIIDIGGESTRPFRPEAVGEAEELRRVIPVVELLARREPGVLISVDTCKEAVARAALEAGAHIINDIFALRQSPAIAALCAQHGAGLVLMHMQGTPETMQESPQYGDVMVDIKEFLRERMEEATAAGLPAECIAVDPGIGFGKTVDHNVEILAGLEYLRLLQRPILIGASRKGFLGKLTGNLPVEEREDQTVAAHSAAVLAGAGIVRTHNVAAAARSLAIIDAIRARQ